MKQVIYLMLTSLIISSCSDVEQKEQTPETETAVEVAEPTNSEGVLWEAKYRCPIPVNQDDRFTDERGFSTFSDSSFANLVIEAIKKGDIVARNDQMQPLSDAETKAALKYVKTARVQSEPGVNELIEDTLNYAPHQIIEILALENWVVEKGSYRLRKEVKEYALVVNTFHDNGHVRGKRILFWISNEDPSGTHLATKN